MRSRQQREMTSSCRLAERGRSAAIAPSPWAGREVRFRCEWLRFVPSERSFVPQAVWEALLMAPALQGAGNIEPILSPWLRVAIVC